MKQVLFIAYLLLFSVWLISPVWAQDPIFYPSKGQSETQLEKDKYECYAWAKKQTGFDPMKTPTTKSAPPAKEEKVMGTGGSALIGGGAGALIGGIAGGGKGALAGGLIGGTGGAVVGSARSSEQREQEERKRKEWEQKEANRYARERNQYNRALGACMEGRGYSVK
jgi:predicted lipid-binding transport protein (Tim44 family)